MRDEFAGELSGGQRKLLEMARALMAEPQLLMLDEPMAGVNPALAQTIIGHVQQLRDEGLTVVFVEHDMDVVRTISDWVVVMSEGEIIAEGGHSSIVANPRVIDAYLGAHHGTPLDREEQDRQLAEAEAASHRREEPRRPTRGGQRASTTRPTTGVRHDRSADAGDADSCSRPTTSSPATSPRSTSSRAPTRRSTTASWSASSGPTAPASRR